MDLKKALGNKQGLKISEFWEFLTLNALQEVFILDGIGSDGNKLIDHGQA